MSYLLLALAVEDANVAPQGVKEAVAMALEQLGGAVRVLQVDVWEPEQMSMTGGTARTPHSVPAQAPARTAPAGQASARAKGHASPQTVMECCYTCACYSSEPGRDETGCQFWGICGRTGRPVYDLKKRCGGWARIGK